MDFWKWYDKNKWDLFWSKYRIIHGLDPDGKDVMQEKKHFKKMERLRKKALNADNPYEAVMDAPSYDQQPMLAKWWDYLSFKQKKQFLLHVWGSKTDGLLFGFDWWIPYFKELGFVTNCGAKKPDEPIVLYRGAEPYFRAGISWTDNQTMAYEFADSWQIICNKYAYGMVTYPEQILAIVKGDALDLNGKPYKSGHEYILDINTVSEDNIYMLDDPEWHDVLAEIKK